MDKYKLLDKLVEKLKINGCEVETIFKELKSNPLFKVSKNGKYGYVVICEAGTKPARYKDVVFSGINPKIQENIEMDKTYVVIVDYQSGTPVYIFVKLDQTNYRSNRIKYLIFNFKRPEYGNFYTTSRASELYEEILSIVS